MPIRVTELEFINSHGSKFSSGSDGRTPGAAKLSFEVKDGECWLIWGRSGSGKSVLLQLLGGLLSPAAGQIERLGDSARGIGLVFQYPEQQFFGTTVDEDLGFGLRQRGLSETQIEERAQEVLSWLGLDYAAIATRSPYALSSGEQRRLAIAAVLMHKPAVLLLDEPVSGLDAKSCRALIKCLGRLKQERRLTMVWSTTRARYAAALADQVIVLADGRQVWRGETEKLLWADQAIEEAGFKLPPLWKLHRKLCRMGYPVTKVWKGVDEAAQELKQLLC